MIKVRLPVLGLYNALVYAFILLPIVVVLLASFTAASYVSFPPKGLSLKAYLAILDYPEFIDSFKISAVVAAGVSLVSSTIGILAALALTRYRFPGRDFLSTFFLSPLMLPGIVLGLALLLFYTRIGLTRTPASFIIGHLIITIPYVIRLVGASLAGFDRSLELAARNLGASAWQAFSRIIFPMILPGVVAGAAFAFIISFDDVSIALFLATPKTVTLPVRIFAYLETGSDPVVTAVTSMLIIIAAIMMVVIERTVGVGRLFGAR